MHINVDMNPTTAHSSSSPIRSTKMSPVTRKSVVIAIALCVFVTNAYEHVGCFKDDGLDSQLRINMISYSEMDINMCYMDCLVGGYNFFGLKNGNECWWANEFNGDGMGIGSCDTICVGDAGQMCGGGDSMDVYITEPVEEPVYDHIGCFQDSLSNRLMESKLVDVDVNMNIDMCYQNCLNLELNFFGLQYGNECWCTDEFVGDGVNPGVCDMECLGDPSEDCGGNLSMDVYELVPIVEEPVEEPVYDHIGCFQDSLSNRLMESKFVNVDVNIDMCYRHCLSFELNFFGLQYSNECWCTDEFVGDGVNPGVCDMECSGDPSEDCGGNLSMDVYELVPIVEEPIEGTVDEEPGYDHIGCFQDSLGNRLMEFNFEDDNMSIEACVIHCYRFFGLQNGNECWCADEFIGDGVNPGVCDTNCSGDQSEICGGNLSMDVYEFRGIR